MSNYATAENTKPPGLLMLNCMPQTADQTRNMNEKPVSREATQKHCWLSWKIENFDSNKLNEALPVAWRQSIANTYGILKTILWLFCMMHDNNFIILIFTCISQVDFIYFKAIGEAVRRVTATLNNKRWAVLTKRATLSYLYICTESKIDKDSTNARQARPEMGMSMEDHQLTYGTPFSESSLLALGIPDTLYTYAGS